MLGTDKEPSLRAKCGTPEGWEALRLTVDKPMDEDGYHASFYGHLLSRATKVIDAPTMRILGIGTILALQRCVYHANTALWIEALWTRQDGVRIAMHGLERRHASEEMNLIRHGLVILRRMEKDGRPRETSRYYSKEEFHTAYPEAYRKATLRRDIPRDEDVARALSISLSTFKRYIRPSNYGRPSPL
jgi:hypothetical protein